jgi:hypothetical protein
VGRWRRGPGPVDGGGFRCHPGVELSFRGVGAVGAVLGAPVAGGVPVQVVVLQGDQADTGGFGGGEGAGLQGGELRCPAAVGGCGGAGGFRGVAAHDFDVVGHPGVAAAVDLSVGLAAAPQRVEGGQTDRAVPKMTCRAIIMASSRPVCGPDPGRPRLGAPRLGGHRLGKH